MAGRAASCYLALAVPSRFELTSAKQDFYYSGLAARPPYPAQVIWGQGDRMLGAKQRRAVHSALGTTAGTLVPGRHFIQEDQAPALADGIAKLVQRALGR